MAGGIEEWDDSVTPAIRTIISVGNLYDVSPVTYPAYPEATTGVRSHKEIFEEHQNERTTESQEEESPDYGIMKDRLDLAEID